MIKAEECDIIDLNWLKGRQYFTFANYKNPFHIGVKSLNAVNHYTLPNLCEFENSEYLNRTVVTFVTSGTLR
jgi:hypothetical protein